MNPPDYPLRPSTLCIHAGTDLGQTTGAHANQPYGQHG